MTSKKRFQLNYNSFVMSINRDIKIPVSFVAAAVGMNQYSSQQEAIDEIYRKNLKLPIPSVLKKSIQKKSDSQIDYIFSQLIPDKISDDLTICKKINMIESYCRADLKKIENDSNSSRDTQKQIKRKYNNIDIDLASGIQSVSQMKSGVRNEKSIIDDFELGNLLKVVERNNKIVSFKIDFPDLDFDIILSGKIDGLIVDKNKNATSIVEAKTRRNRLFRRVPIYENVQCHVYMKMFNVSNTIHIESFNGLSRVSKLEFDDTFWTDIIEKLAVFVRLYSVKVQDNK